MTNYSCRAGPKTCFTWKILLLFNWTQSLLRKTCSKNHKGGLPWGSWVCGVCTEKSNKQKATLGIVPVVPVVPVDISHRCLGWDTTSWCLVYLFLFVSITFLSVSISMFYLDIPGFYLPMRSRSARRSITCRLKIMRATELPSRIGGCMAQHGAWCNRSQSVWSKHGTLKAFQHTSLEQGIFGNLWDLGTGWNCCKLIVAWCGAKFDPRKSEVAAALWQMAFRRSPLWSAASSHMSCIKLYQFLNQVVSSGM